MHRFHSKSVIYRFRFTAILFCLRYVLPSVAIVLLMLSLLRDDKQLTVIAFAVGGLALVCLVIQCVLARKSLCPLCMTPVLASQGCSKHRNARTLLGSHRLRVALAVLAKGSFTCPYCHEKSVMEVRTRSRREMMANSRH